MPPANASFHPPMSYFLQHVAQDLRAHFADLSRVVVVFPNRRAGLFLNDYLVEDAPDDTPLWAPRYVTISELFRELSDVTLNDAVDSVCRLYAHYVDLLRSAGDAAADELSLDTFYGWADRILADFDDVDKNMADASQLFRNLEELKELDDMGFLDDEQKKLIGSFFSNFDPDHKSELRERFRRLWNALLPLYRRLNEELLAEGKAYEGALYRRVVNALAEEHCALPADVDCYAVVGFNVLDKAEQHLFEIMKKAGKARFYWDYDSYYADPYKSRGFEAGLFIEENLRNFPNALPAECFDNFRNIEQIEMVSATSEAAQAQSVSGWLEHHLPPDETAHRRTAVVLCNENLLQPVLRVFPERVHQVNVTKGFPLGHAEANTLVEQGFADLERRGISLPAVEVLDRLSARVNERAKEVCGRPDFDTSRFEDVLQSEAFYLMATLLNRLRIIAAAGRLEVGVSTLRRVVRQIVRQTTVPFHGEPAVGLQVLGVLETRCLDFDDVLLLSVNEGTLPQTPNDNSFIPYMLRKAFGLTTPERRTAVYAYYFYRLVQRARRLRMTFNSSAEGLSSGEMSRFMTQLRVDRNLPIVDLALRVDLDSLLHTPAAVDKPQPDFVREDMNAYFDSLYSATDFRDTAEIETYMATDYFETLTEDPVISHWSLFDRLIDEVYRPALDRYEHKVAELNQIYVRGLCEMYGWTKAPDANSTLRMTYGSVRGYSPRDAVQYDWHTSLKGMFEKENPADPDYVVDEKLRQHYLTKNYGPYADANGELPTCFLTNNDITGGNSGSAVLNARGELIGLAFDGNIESLSSDLRYNPQLQRCINADIRYILFVIDTYGGSHYLINEMDIRR